MKGNLYEGMFILDSSRYARESTAVVGEVEGLIRSHGGEILVSRLYEERRLAYSIKGHRKGTYWLTYFRLEGPQLATLTRQCEISDTILRHLFLKIDPKLSEAVLAHATGRSVGDSGTDDSPGGRSEETADEPVATAASGSD